MEPLSEARRGPFEPHLDAANTNTQNGADGPSPTSHRGQAIAAMLRTAEAEAWRHTFRSLLQDVQRLAQSRARRTGGRIKYLNVFIRSRKGIRCRLELPAEWLGSNC